MSKEDIKSWKVNIFITGIFNIEFLIFNFLLQNLFWLSGLAVSSGILYYFLDLHFKNSEQTKRFKRVQFWTMLILFLMVTLLAVLVEGVGSSDGAIFLVLFLGAKEIAEHIVEGLEIIKTSN